MIAAPRGDEMIIAEDKLIVLGNDNQIDLFRREVEAKGIQREPMSFLGHFTLKAFLLEMHSPLIGKTIREARFREKVNGLVVGLERNNVRYLNPDSDTVLKSDDLLLIVGEVDKIDMFDITDFGKDE